MASLVDDLLLLARLDQGRPLAREPVDVVAIVLHGQEPLLNLPPWREEHTAIVLHQPVQLAVSGVDLQEVTELAHRVTPKRHAPLGPDRHDVPVVAVAGDHVVEGGP